MIKAAVWITPADHALLSRILLALQARDRANGVPLPPDAHRDMILSTALTEGLKALAERHLPRKPSDEPPVDALILANLLQMLNAPTAQRAASGVAP